MSTRAQIIQLVQEIEDEQFLKVLLNIVSEYQKINSANNPETYFKPYTQKEYEKHLTQILHDMDGGESYSQEEVEKLVKNWEKKA